MNAIIPSSASDAEKIKFLGIIHIVSNILSGGLLGVLCIGGYLLLHSSPISPKVREVCYEIVNFNLSFILYFIGSCVLMLVLIGFVLLPIVYVIWFILMILGAIKHFSGENYIYPMSIKLVK